MVGLRPVPAAILNNNNDDKSSWLKQHGSKKHLAWTVILVSSVVTLASFVATTDKSSSSNSTFNQVLVFDGSKTKKSKARKRRLTIDLGDGSCQWTQAVPYDESAEGKDGVVPFGTVVASYPGSGIRMTWQLIEALTGIMVGDEFEFTDDNNGNDIALAKTSYPHYEGMWSFDDTMDQIIYVIRNP